MRDVRCKIAFITAIFFSTPAFLMTARGEDNFNYFCEQFADVKILRYKNDDFDSLTLNQKKFAYYLYQAALYGREIMYEQNYAHNLTIKRTLEAIYSNYSSDKENEDFKKLEIYLKRIWFSNGIHHHYSNKKFAPGFGEDFFKAVFFDTPAKDLPLWNNETKSDLYNRIAPIIFDENIAKTKISQEENTDLVKNSAVNFYENVSQELVKAFYENMQEKNNSKISHGLNSKVIFDGEKLYENTYKQNGMYHEAIEKIVYWLEKAAHYAETTLQVESLHELIGYYKTGDLQHFNQYNILWVQDTEPTIDLISGFIETYNDPLGRKGSFESVVFMKDLEATQKFEVLAHEAPWFEENSPIDPEFKKENVTGISYRIINVITESGDASPSTPIGINLPNANWIREDHGSKSVSLGNIQHAYKESSKESGMLKEFYLPQYHELIREHGVLASKLHTGLHEVIGHASGKLREGVGEIHETLENYAAPIEEARADLVALYFIGNEHMIDLELIPSTKVRNSLYVTYLTNGVLTQMSRIKLGENIQQAHMRNRALISRWVLEQGSSEGIVELRTIETEEGAKTFVVINDFEGLNELFGNLLAIIQKVKSTGDYNEAQELIEIYGVELDRELHEQVLTRYEKLNIAPYGGFINPQLVPCYNDDGDIIDVNIMYPKDFTEQMLYYAKEYSTLPHYN